MEKFICTTYNESEFRNLIAEVLTPIVASAIQKITPLPNNSSLSDANVFITRKEVCKLLRLSLPTVTRLTKEGVLKAKIVGSCYRYSKSQIDNYMNNSNKHK